MLLHIIDLKFLEAHKLLLTFSSGLSREVNLEKELTGEVFEPLRNIQTFSQATLVGHTVAWENGADFAPEFLQDLMHEQGTVLASGSAEAKR